MKKIMREPKWSRSHVALVRPGGDRRVQKIMREPKWSRSSPSVIVLKSQHENKGTLHQESKAKEKESDRLRIEIHRESLVETGRTNIYSLCESSDNRFAIFTAIPHP